MTDQRPARQQLVELAHLIIHSEGKLAGSRLLALLDAAALAIQTTTAPGLSPEGTCVGCGGSVLVEHDWSRRVNECDIEADGGVYVSQGQANHETLAYQCVGCGAFVDVPPDQIDWC